MSVPPGGTVITLVGGVVAGATLAEIRATVVVDNANVFRFATMSLLRKVLGGKQDEAGQLSDSHRRAGEPQ
jgi:hypothetical protein